MSKEKIARYYVPEHNPDGHSFPGVPLADVTETQWIDTPPDIQAEVDASDMYRKTKPDSPATEPEATESAKRSHKKQVALEPTPNVAVTTEPITPIVSAPDMSEVSE